MPKFNKDIDASIYSLMSNTSIGILDTLPLACNKVQWFCPVKKLMKTREAINDLCWCREEVFKIIRLKKIFVLACISLGIRIRKENGNFLIGNGTMDLFDKRNRKFKYTNCTEQMCPQDFHSALLFCGDMRKKPWGYNLYEWGLRIRRTKRDII